MIPPTVSVVVVSRDRPDALRRCLTGLGQVQYPQFEIVVVADAKGCAAASAMPVSRDIKVVPFERPNISQARNLGVSHAAGAVIAFIDDDAVPEPTWLTHLTAPFARAHVAATGGFVRGRNGISFQWRARSVDATGTTHPIEVSDGRATVLRADGIRATKTEGTNMAVRRSVLADLGGFDPGFAFYLDETDLNLRLMRAGHATAIVPMAEVHHGYAASPRRRPDRVPRDLFDIGASWAVWQRKYIDERDRPDHWRALRSAERVRVMGHMVAGRLLPRDVRHLLGRLDQGYGQGMMRQRGGGAIATDPLVPFAPITAPPRVGVVLSGRIWQAARLRAEAMRRVRSGEIVTLVLLSPTTLYHHVRFTPEGYWEQRGGLFGRADRDELAFRLWTFGDRIRRERERIAAQRGLSG